MPPLSLLAPRYWPNWLMVIPFTILPFLPWRLQFACGRLIGRVAYRLAHRRRTIAEINLARCFPERSPAEREVLLREHFEALGIGLIETAQCWWAPDWRLRPRVDTEGMEYLRKAKEAGRGVIMLTGHFTTLEIGGRLLAMQQPVLAVYRPDKNPVTNYLMRSRRRARSNGVIERDDVRKMLLSLRRKATIWYAPDQAYIRKGGVTAPFFGNPAPSNTATSRIAKSTGAAVIPFFVKRLPSGRYRLKILPPLDNFPSGDDVADAGRVNAVLEEGVREAPEQYLWIHDRFKNFTRPVKARPNPGHT